jgi:hypothetical protein
MRNRIIIQLISIYFKFSFVSVTVAAVAGVGNQPAIVWEEDLTIGSAGACEAKQQC